MSTWTHVCTPSLDSPLLLLVENSYNLLPFIGRAADDLAASLLLGVVGRLFIEGRFFDLDLDLLTLGFLLSDDVTGIGAFVRSSRAGDVFRGDIPVRPRSGPNRMSSRFP